MTSDTNDVNNIICYLLKIYKTLYFHGGIDENLNFTNDLWKYSISLNQWTLIATTGIKQIQRNVKYLNIFFSIYKLDYIMGWNHPKY